MRCRKHSRCLPPGPARGGRGDADSRRADRGRNPSPERSKVNRVQRRATEIVLLVAVRCAGTPSHSAVPATLATPVHETSRPTTPSARTPPIRPPISAYRVPTARLADRCPATACASSSSSDTRHRRSLPDSACPRGNLGPARRVARCDGADARHPQAGHSETGGGRHFVECSQSLFELDHTRGVDWLALLRTGLLVLVRCRARHAQRIALGPVFPHDAVEAKRRTLLAQTAREADDPVIIGRRNSMPPLRFRSPVRPIPGDELRCPRAGYAERRLAGVARDDGPEAGRAGDSRRRRTGVGHRED